MQTLIFSSQQPSPSKTKGFSLMELLIYLALAAVFIGGILTLTGKVGSDSEVRQVVQDISEIDNAVRGFYGAQRLSTPPVTGRMESVAASQLDRMKGDAATGNIITQFGSAIFVEPSTGGYGWPNYVITYTGMRTETCASLLGALTGPIAAQLRPGDATATLGAWTVGDDDRLEGLTSAADIEAFCAGTGVAGTDETYTVHALFRI